MSTNTTSDEYVDYRMTTSELGEPLLIEHYGEAGELGEHWYIGSPWQTWDRAVYRHLPPGYLERETYPCTSAEIALLIVAGGAGRLVAAIAEREWTDTGTLYLLWREEDGATTVREWLNELVPEHLADGCTPTATPYAPGISVVLFRDAEGYALAYLVPNIALDAAGIPRGETPTQAA